MKLLIPNHKKGKFMKLGLIASLVVTSLVSACASPQKNAQTASASKVSACSPAEINIQGLSFPFGGNTVNWNAVCRNTTYFCSGYNTGRGAFTDVSCQKK